MSPSISILLPTRGRPQEAERLLQSVVEISADPSRMEVIQYVDEDGPILKWPFQLIQKFK